VADHCRPQNLVLPPGAGFSYSNMGYVLAGQLIETVTGMSWWEAVESIVLRPLGIEPAFIAAPGRTPTTRAVATGHSVNQAVGGRTRPVRQSLAPAEAPAGALAVSAADLVALGRTHIGAGVPQLLPAAYAEQMRQAVPAADPFGLADGWGLGLAVFRDGGARWVGHDGNANGTSCYLRIDPANGWVVALTTNANTGYGLWQELLAKLAHAGVPIGRSRAWAPPARPTVPPPDCAGTYANGDIDYVVAQNNGRLHLAVDGDVLGPLTVYDGLTFSLWDPASGRQVPGGRFMRDRATGKVDGIQVGGRLARRRVYASSSISHSLVSAS
jgi:CubicO group peptidase (beta-lactamase class C family)